MIEIKHISVSELKNSPINPRKIDERQFEVLCQSLKSNPDFFEARPILCNKDMVVFAGNMRLRAAIAIGLTTAPVVIMDIPEERQKELMLRDNHSNGTYDYELLNSHFDTEFLFSVGFDEKQLTDMPTGTKNVEFVTCPHCTKEFLVKDGKKERRPLPSPTPEV